MIAPRVLAAGAAGDVRRLVGSLDGRVVAALRDGDHVDVWDAEGGRVVRSEVVAGARCLAASSAVVAVGDEAGLLVAHAHGVGGWRRHAATEATAVVISPDGGNVLVGSASGALEAVRTLTGRPSGAVALGGGVVDLLLVEAGRAWVAWHGATVSEGTLRPFVRTRQRPAPPGRPGRLWGRPDPRRGGEPWGCVTSEGVWQGTGDGWLRLADRPTIVLSWPDGPVLVDPLEGGAGVRDAVVAGALVAVATGAEVHLEARVG